jgi:hypothetical protein
VVAALVTLDVPAGAPAAGAKYARLGHPRAFGSCARLVGYARHYMAVTHGAPETPVQPLSEGGPTVVAGAPTAGAPTAGAAPPTASSGGSAYSTTNTQEPGVDEPDSLKTDGSTIFAISQSTLYAVGVTTGKPTLVGSLDLGSGTYGAQLLRSGDRLIVITRANPPGPVPLAARAPGAAIAPAPGFYPSPYYYGGRTTLSEIDAHNPAAMKVTGTLTIDGSFVDARQTGSTARIVVSSAPAAIARPALRGRAKGYVPRMHFRSRHSTRRFDRPVAGCGQIAQPAQFSGLGMLTILTINLNNGLSTAQSDALMADAQVVYGSQNSLYVTTEKWIAPATPPDQLPRAQVTQIDRFDASDPDRTAFVASGEVPGYLLNQFSLSESGGYLRVASTSRPDWWGGAVPQLPSQSYVTVLRTQGNQLVTVGQISGLGRGQKIYSVRFVGGVGYVVTFRQVDPLYTIDLSDPVSPRVAGKLELEGYSSYLHPLSDGLLLGIGQDVGAGNEPSGSQLELFDVSDASSPKLLHKTTLGQGSSSQAQYDHHAFLYWPPTKLAVLPVQIYPTQSAPPSGPPTGTTGTGTTSTSTTSGQTGQPGDNGFTGAIGFHLDRSGIAEVGRISHPPTGGYAPSIVREVVIGDELYTLSAEGILASSLGKLAPGVFTAFPARSRPPAVGSAGPRPPPSQP